MRFDERPVVALSILYPGQIRQLELFTRYTTSQNNFYVSRFHRHSYKMCWLDLIDVMHFLSPNFSFLCKIDIFINLYICYFNLFTFAFY